MNLKIIFISICLSLVFPLWCAPQENALDSDCLIPTRRLSQSQRPIENLEIKQQIARNLHSFFGKFDETATTLMVLNNLCEAMNEEASFTVPIWEDYMTEHKVLTTEQMPLFRDIYGSVLRALREGGASYFNSENYFKSSCFLELLYGELGDESFPKVYLKPLIFAEWRIYQRDGIVSFAQNFALCLGKVSRKIQSFIGSSANSIEQWDTLPIENLEPIKELFDFKDSLETLRLLKLNTGRLGLRKITEICRGFLSSVNSFHEVCSPLAAALQVIIDNKKFPEKKASPHLKESHLQTWSVEGGKISTLISPSIKEKRKTIQNPDYILIEIVNGLKEDAEALPVFKIKGAEEIICSGMEINTSEVSVRIFLNNLWPSLSPFFREGGLIPFGVYGAQNTLETEESLRSLRAKTQELQEVYGEKVTQKQELYRSLNEKLIEKIRSLEKDILTEKKTLANTLSSLEKEASIRSELAASYLRSTAEAEKQSKKRAKEYTILQKKFEALQKNLNSTPAKPLKLQTVTTEPLPSQKADVDLGAAEAPSQPGPFLEEAHGNTPPTPKRKSPPPAEQSLPSSPEKPALRAEAIAFTPSESIPIPTVFPPSLPMALVPTPYGMAWAAVYPSFQLYPNT